MQGLAGGGLSVNVVGYCVRKLVFAIPLLILLTFGVFALTRVAGDPAAMYVVPGMTPEQIDAIRTRYRLNDPILVQYLHYMKGLLSGDMGYSRAAGMPVKDALATRLPATFELTAASLVVALVLGISLGTLSAVKSGTGVDQFTRILALGGVSVPIFWLAMMLLALFYAKWQVLPIGRYSPHLWPSTARHTNLYVIDALINRSPAQLWDAIRHLVLPAICLGYLEMATIMRMMRSTMLEVLGEPYIATARAKGISERVVIGKHARRNALVPVVTVAALSFGNMLAGATLTEKVFNWPGMGLWAVDAILSLDTTSIMAYVTVTGAIYMITNVLADVLYALLDPRIRLGG